MIDRQIFHFVNECFVRCEDPPQQANEEDEEYNKGDNGPDGDVIDTLKNVLIHGNDFKFFLIITSRPQLFSLP
jgi:hypothetical protein